MGLRASGNNLQWRSQRVQLQTGNDIKNPTSYLSNPANNDCAIYVTFYPGAGLASAEAVTFKCSFRAVVNPVSKELGKIVPTLVECDSITPLMDALLGSTGGDCSRWPRIVVEPSDPTTCSVHWDLWSGYNFPTNAFRFSALLESRNDLAEPQLSDRPVAGPLHALPDANVPIFQTGTV